MAEEKGDPGALLSRAKAQEKEYDWLGAAATYSRLLESTPHSDILRIGKIAEAIAHAYFQESFQSESIDEFRAGLDRAAESYSNARKIYEGSSTPRANSYMSRCDAMMKFIDFWRSEKGAEKRESITESWRLAKDAMSGFEAQGEHAEFSRTYNDLWQSIAFIGYFQDSWESEIGYYLEGADFGGRVIQNLPESANEDDLAETHTLVAGLLENLAIRGSESMDKSRDYYRKASDHWRKALALSKERSFVARAKGSPLLGAITPSGLTPDEVLVLFAGALELCRRTRDKSLIGFALLDLAFQTEWQLPAIDDIVEVYAQAEKAVQYAVEANRNFAVLSPQSPILSSNFVDPRWDVSAFVMMQERDPAKRRALAKKASEHPNTLMRLSEELGLPLCIKYARLGLVEGLNELAKLENSKELKRKMLDEAIEQAKMCVQESNRLERGNPFNRGVSLRDLAMAQHELADMHEDANERIGMLTEAIRNRRDSLVLLKAAIQVNPELNPGDYGILGSNQYEYGTWLTGLYELARDKRTLQDALAAFEECGSSYQMAESPSRVAEAYWKAAQICGDLEDHMKGAEDYAQAARSYRTAAAKIPRLKEFYEDYSQYMQAWSEISNARYYHGKQAADSSRACWESAAKLHESSRRWQYLASYYLAWAEEEKAEDLSRNDRSDEAVHSFDKAAGLFETASSSMKAQFRLIEDGSERAMATKAVEAAGLRQSYCRARMVLEEAKVLDKNGEESAASERFGKAAEMLQKMVDAVGTDGEKREFQLIVVLSRAWQSMTRAEAEASPDLYAEASRLFDQAKDLSLGEKSRLTAQAHGRFCKALEAGARFADTGELSLHETAVQNLNSAANYYAKAGLENASEYTKASKLLLDGYVYTGKASKEEDQSKKARLFAMAEKVLRASATSFDKVGQRGKKEQVEKLLERAMEERELAVSLTEVLIAPDIISATTSFEAPVSTGETAVGLERFEHADMHMNLVAKPKELHVGEELILEFELVNAGRGTAQLTKVEETVPKGFVIVREPERYRMEDSQINLRGRRLDTLKTEDLKLVLRPTAKGNFKLKPRIMYLDETGTTRSYEPAPTEIVVREMGISGWIKGT